MVCVPDVITVEDVHYSGTGWIPSTWACTTKLFADFF